MRDFDPTASEFISTGYLAHSRPGLGVRHYDPISIMGAVAGPLIGGMMAPDPPAPSAPRPQMQQQPMQQKSSGGGNNNNMGVMGLIGQAAGGVRGANAAHEAAGVLSDASDSATNQQTAFYNQSRGDMQPYINNGNIALSSMAGKFANGQLGGQFTGDDYLANKDPGYDFQLKQGNQALQNSQAAHDGALSGSAMKGMIDYNQGMASTGYQNAYNRWLSSQQNSYGQLSGLTNIGLGAAGHLASAAPYYSKGIAESVAASGSAKASGIMGYANAMNNGVQGAMQAGGMVGMNSLLNGMSKALLGKGNSGGDGGTDMSNMQYGQPYGDPMAMGGDQQGGAGGSMGQGGDYGMMQQQDPWTNPYSNEGNNYQTPDTYNWSQHDGF